MPLDFRWLIRPRKKIRPIFLRSTSLLNKIVPTNLGACKPIFYTIYTSHLRWDSTMRSMRHCFYHADRMQYFTISQYKLHSFSIRDDRSTRGLLAKKLKKNQKPPIRPGVCHFCSASCGRVFEKTLIELRSNIIKNLLCICWWFYQCVIFKSFWYARHFEYSCKRLSLNDWKQTAQRLKLQERLLTINRMNIIRWNIYRDNNFHSRRQVLKCL